MVFYPKAIGTIELIDPLSKDAGACVFTFAEKYGNKIPDGYQNEPRLRLSRLPYGTHTLHIRGQAANGLWGSNDLLIKINVLRPFYLQFWFILLSIVGILIGVRLLFKWRTKDLQRNQILLEKEVALQTEKIQGQTEELRQLDTLKTQLYTNITHEFRTPLEALKTLGTGLKTELKTSSRFQTSTTLNDTESTPSVFLLNDKKMPILAKTAPTLDDIFLQKIQDVIHKRLNDSNLGIVYLCKAVNLSHTQVFRKLKAITGDNPTLYIRKLRLQHAAQLLQTTELNISEIAYETGFSDPSYFSRAFHEEFGTPPSALRK